MTSPLGVFWDLVGVLRAFARAACVKEETIYEKNLTETGED